VQLNLQDGFLVQVKKEKAAVVVYLVNGFQLKGTVKGFDNFTIFLESPEGKLQMVYKHAVTTVQCLKTMSFAFLSDAFKEMATHQAAKGGPDQTVAADTPA
jgi:host factor-I protein